MKTGLNFLFIYLVLFFSPLMYNHTASSHLYYKYLQDLQRLHAKYAQSAKTSQLNLGDTARKTLDKNMNCFYCKKVATQVFVDGLVLLIEGIV